MVQSFLPILAAALVPLASAHVALWTPSGFYERNDGYEAATPLSNKGAGEFWFHGVNKPSGNITPTKLPVGKEVTLELSCNKQYTSMGNGRSSGNIACPDGIEEWKSLHINPDKPVYLGCALAIAYKSLDQISSLEDIKTEDFTVFSVKNECVKDLKTNFAIPQTMPKCPPGGCICAWFWQGQDSANEMYMTGFACDVEGGVDGTVPTPQAAKPCSGSSCVSGPKQPLIWANSDPKHPNNAQASGGKKPSYTPAYGFMDGAQDIMGTGSAPSTGTGTSSGPSSGSSSAPVPSTSSAPSNGGSKSGSPGNTDNSGSDSGSGSGSPSNDDDSNGGDDQQGNDDSEAPQPSPTQRSGRGGRGKGRGWGNRGDRKWNASEWRSHRNSRRNGAGI